MKKIWTLLVAAITVLGSAHFRLRAAVTKLQNPLTAKKQLP